MLCETFPKISCLMVTAGRLECLRFAVRCFFNQTYPNKELIVLSQGTSEQNKEIQGHLSLLPQQDIQFLEAPPSLSLGEMRNTSVELSTGTIICQWDDDDLYHPARLLTQYRALQNNAVAVLYSNFLKLFADTGRLYWIDNAGGTADYEALMKAQPYKQFLAGSVMFRKECFYRCRNRLYPELGVQSGKEEDLNALQKLMQIGPVKPVSEGYQYIYVFHAGNVYDRRHHEWLFHKKNIAKRETLVAFQSSIETTLNSAGWPRAVEACTTDLVNFDDGNSIGEEVVFAYARKL